MYEREVEGLFTQGSENKKNKKKSCGLFALREKNIYFMLEC